MKLTKIEKDLLVRALKNQENERREFPFWRPALKAPLPALPQEVGQDAVNPALYETSSRAYCSDINPGAFLQQVKDIFGEDIVPARTNAMTVDSFMRAGFLYAAGKVYHARADAQKTISAWQKKAPWLEFFILPEFEPYADLFAAEIVGGFQGAEYKTRPMVVDPDADPKAVEVFDKAALSLEKKGAVVRVQGQDMTRKWTGVNITKAGADALKELEAAETAPAPPEPEPTGPRLKCFSCKGLFHAVTSEFDPDQKPRGNMFELLPKYKARSWEEWAPDWQGDSLTCPGCGENIVNPHTGFLHDGVIIDLETAEA